MKTVVTKSDFSVVTAVINSGQGFFQLILCIPPYSVGHNTVKKKIVFTGVFRNFAYKIRS